MNPTVGVTTIAEATYRFIHGEITCWSKYKELMDKIMNQRMALLDASDQCFATKHNITFTEASDRFFANKTQAYTQMANERLYGKTPLEMFVALEIAVHLAHQDNPDVAVRNYIKRCFLGIRALHQAVGPWVDVSDEAASMYGRSDLGANIASSCMWFTSFYTKTVSTTGKFSFAIAPVHDFVAKRPSQEPLSDSVLFDYIHLLFPKTSRIPRVDATKLHCKVNDMQARINVMGNMDHHKIYRYGSYGSWFGIFESMSPNGSTMRLNSARMDQILKSNEDNINVLNCMSIIMHMGTNKAELQDSAKAEIALTDAVMVPFITKYMNYAASVSDIWGDI
jgi:hypothetical protein